MHGVLSHLVEKICLLEKQNMEILGHLKHLPRNDKEMEENKDNKKEQKRLSGQQERRGKSISRLVCQIYKGIQAKKEKNHQDRV